MYWFDTKYHFIYPTSFCLLAIKDCNLSQQGCCSNSSQTSAKLHHPLGIIAHHSEVRRLGESAGQGDGGALVGEQGGVVGGEEGDLLQPEHPGVNLRQLRA